MILYRDGEREKGERERERGEGKEVFDVMFVVLSFFFPFFVFGSLASLSEKGGRQNRREHLF